MADPLNVFSIVLAGGEGRRLAPLTEDRAKPAVPFGGHYRLIDFVLSNLVNGGFRRVAVLTQYKSHSLDVHLSRSWQLAPSLGNYVAAVPAQMRKGPTWYTGSANAIWQNLNLIEDERPSHVFVFGADHIYRMDPRPMLDQHIATGAGLTVAGIRVPIGDADQFGIIEKGKGTAITAFKEKPSDPVGLPDSPNQVLASMGNYLFDTELLVDIISRDASDEESAHDMGGSIVPRQVNEDGAHVYDFSQNTVPGERPSEHAYWRDVGTIDAYYDAHMDLVAPEPEFNLYNHSWPIHTAGKVNPPPKLVDVKGQACSVSNSMVCAGAIVSGARLNHSVLSPGVRVDSGAEIDGAVLLDNVQVGAGAVVRNAILDKNCVVPPGMVIDGAKADPEQYTISEGGIVVVAKGTKLA